MTEPRPGPVTCAACGRECDEWVWDESEPPSWELDQQWWGMAYHCSRRCYLDGDEYQRRWGADRVGHQIIVQPDGRLCVFSTNTDTIILADATGDELVDFYADRAAERAREETRRVVDAVAGGNPRSIYAQFVITYDEAVEAHRRHGGDPNMIYAATAGAP